MGNETLFFFEPIKSCLFQFGRAVIRTESGPGQRGNATKSHATARGLQLPICSLDPRWQQPIAVQQVLNGHRKPNETAEASLKVT